MAKTGRTTKSAAKSQRALKRTPAKATAPKKRATPSKLEAAAPVVERAPQPAAGRESAPARRRRWPELVLSGLLVVVAAFAAVLLVRGDAEPEPIRAGVPAAVSPDTLVPFSSSRDVPVYWAGRVPWRKLELTTTRAGTFVRYLPAGVAIGDSQPALTIATYPLRGAYGTTTRRAKSPAMSARKTRSGGLAVWSRAQPTSVYLAFPGVPHLVEVYSPKPEEARSLALSGRIRPVR